MKYIDEFRQPDASQRLIREIHETASQPWTLMEVCGGQTHGLLRYGIDTALEGAVRLIHGPGCPVCVTPLEAIDLAIELSQRPGVTLASFGDMLRVPGSSQSLLQSRAAGGRVRIVYSPLDAVTFAREHPDQHVVFFAVGFETTAPATALAVHQATELGLDNFSMLVAHVRVQPAMELLAASRDNSVQGFLRAGHVCTVAGYESYRSFVAEYHLPVVVTGFEPIDLLTGILECVRQLERGQAELVNCYGRSAAAEGNVRALEIMDDVYEICDRPWRGLGEIQGGGFRLRPQWRGTTPTAASSESNQPQRSQPSVAAATCSPDGLDQPSANTLAIAAPLIRRSVPMVSAEGACAAYYRYAAVRSDVE